MCIDDDLQAGPIPRVGQVRAAGPDPAQAEAHRAPRARVLSDDAMHDHHRGLPHVARLPVPQVCLSVKLHQFHSTNGLDRRLLAFLLKIALIWRNIS